MKTLPDIISLSRGAAAVCMLFFPVFGAAFWALYCWCGLSDMIDGPVARMMNAESAAGALIDSLADLVFVICSCILILPAVRLPAWMWIWVVVIGVVKMAAVCITSIRRRRLVLHHSMMNRIAGLLLFCLPFALVWLNPVVPSIAVCAAASFSAVDDIFVEHE